MSALRVRIVNETPEPFELDDLSFEPGAWAGDWVLPVRIEAHSVALLRAVDGDAVCAEASCTGDGEFAYLIGGDPDRPVYVHLTSPALLPRASVEVWAPPMCCTHVEQINGALEVLVEPLHRPCIDAAA